MRLAAVFALVISSLTGAAALAQDWPMRPVKLVVPGPPGQSSDIYARYFATRLSSILGQSVIVDNKAGGNGFIGALAVTQAPPDGYTVFVAGSSPMAQNLPLFKSIPYDPVKDFRWVGGLLQGTSVVVVSAGSPHKDLRDLIAAAKKEPGKLNYGSYAAAYRLSTEWLNQVSGIETRLVNYKGGAQVVTDLMAGQIDFAMIEIAAVSQLIKGGQLRALGVTGDRRHPSIPEVPMLTERGLPQYGRASWVGFAVRAGTPDTIVEKLTSAVLRVHAEPASKQFAEQHGAALMPLSGSEMTNMHAGEIAKFEQIARSARIEKE